MYKNMSEFPEDVVAYHATCVSWMLRIDVNFPAKKQLFSLFFTPTYANVKLDKETCVKTKFSPNLVAGMWCSC